LAAIADDSIHWRRAIDSLRVENNRTQSAGLSTAQDDGGGAITGVEFA